MASLLRLSAVAVLVTICATAGAPGAEDAPLPLRFAKALSYGARVELLVSAWEGGGPPEFTNVQLRMTLTGEHEPVAGAPVYRFSTRDVRVETNKAGQMADPKNVELLRTHFEKLQVSIPIGADGRVDDGRSAALAPPRDPYARAIITMLAPPFRVPPPEARGRAVPLREGRVSEASSDIQPHIAYFDGWVSGRELGGRAGTEHLFTSDADDADNATIGKFVYHGSTPVGVFDLRVITNVKDNTLLRSTLRQWSRLEVADAGVEGWKTYHVWLQSGDSLENGLSHLGSGVDVLEGAKDEDDVVAAVDVQRNARDFRAVQSQLRVESFSHSLCSSKFGMCQRGFLPQVATLRHVRDSFFEEHVPCFVRIFKPKTHFRTDTS